MSIGGIVKECWLRSALGPRYDAAKNDAAKLKELKAGLETAIGAKLGYNASRWALHRLYCGTANGKSIARVWACRYSK